MFRRWRRAERPSGSLVHRLGALVGASTGAVVAVIATTAFLSFDHFSLATLDQSLRQRALQAASAGAVERVAGRVSPGVLGAADVRIAVLSPSGTVVTSSRAEPSLVLSGPEFDVALGRSSESMRTIRATDGTPWRVVAVPAESGALVLAQSLVPRERTMRRVLAMVTCLGLGGIGLSIGATVIMARRAVRPISQLTVAAEEISRTLDFTPFKVAGNGEVARLGSAFNRMLSAVNEAQESQRRLVADAGHELRTPLTSMRTNFELLASDEKLSLPSKIRNEITEAISGQLEEMTELISDLISLSREQLTETSIFDLADVVSAALGRAARRAPFLNFDVTLETFLTLGDPTASERAVLNVLDNAIKWSPPEGTVAVSLKGGVLSIADMGPGINATDRDKIFERFWRSPEARAMPGSGLGLSIVDKTMREHNGEIQVSESLGGGTLVRLTWPAANRSLDTQR